MDTPKSENNDSSLNETIPSGNHDALPEKSMFYGIYIPQENKDDSISQYVYSDKIEALRILKKHSSKRARFKVFATVEDATTFAENGSENVQSDFVSPTEEGSPMPVGEKSSFRGPKPQELVKLRKSIESGDLEYVKTKVWDNPRFLISSGDTPSILQEGYRYNALHVAAKTEHVEMCKLILETITNISFMQLLYGEANNQFCADVMAILLDCYLNMPDKGMNETPLHFAAKWGRYETVELLTSYKECKMRPNKFGELPVDVICQRIEKNESLINKIRVLLNEQYYIPVLRSEDNSIQPKIGEPFSPKKPPVLNTDILSPRMEIQALAGPMSKTDAEEFSKKWKFSQVNTGKSFNFSVDDSLLNTSDDIHNDNDRIDFDAICSTPKKRGNIESNCKSPLVRLKLEGFISPVKKLGSPVFASPVKENAQIRLTDLDKGLERLGRKLAKEHVIGWAEFWPFLGTFANLQTAKGLKLLENYFKYRTQIECSLNNLIESKSNHSLRSISLDFTDKFSSHNSEISNSCVSPMTNLCSALESCHINDKSRSIKDHGDNSSIQTKLHDYEHDILNSINNPGLNPFLCVEKSCQVFAKRMSTFLINVKLGHNLIMSSLISEIKHLQSTIKSFSDDVRFVSVNFHLVHSRISKLVTEFVSNKQVESKVELNTIRKIINSLIENPYQSLFDATNSNDLANDSHMRRRKKMVKGESRDLICILSHILSYLAKDEKKSFATTEATCIEVWSNASECNCQWMNRTQPKVRNHLMRRNHFHREASAEFSFPKMEYAARKLSMNAEEPILKHSSDSDNDSDEETFFTPPSTPPLLEKEDVTQEISSEDEMFDVPNDTFTAFIEGREPTRLDLYVYQALEDCDINSDEYPNTYLWKHAISLYSEAERECWPSPAKKIKMKLSEMCGYSSDSSKQTNLTEKWKNIVGPYSPRRK